MHCKLVCAGVRVRVGAAAACIGPRLNTTPLTDVGERLGAF